MDSCPPINRDPRRWDDWECVPFIECWPLNVNVRCQCPSLRSCSDLEYGDLDHPTGLVAWQIRDFGYLETYLTSLYCKWEEMSLGPMLYHYWACTRYSFLWDVITNPCNCILSFMCWRLSLVASFACSSRVSLTLLACMKWTRIPCIRNYRKVSNIRRILVGNKIVDHSDVVGASPVGAAPTTS